MLRTVRVLLGMTAMLAACSGPKDAADPNGGAPKGSEAIACALGGAEAFEPVCTVDRDAKTLTVRHPDGAFRRFAIVRDGRGLVVADGAEQAVTAVEGDKLGVTVGRDRYRFPMTIKPGAADAPK